MVQGHDSFMSASDAAPLPRLGEVFFDVRGSSRSMRLSWYSDTGIAVFSIWQGGMCTGTFRLPMGDLPRMVEILQAGPDGRGPAGSGRGGELGGAGYGGPQDYPTGSVLGPGADEGYPGAYPRDLGPGYGRDDLAAPGYRRDEPTGPGYRRDEPTGPGYRRDEPTGPGYRREEPSGPGYRRDELADPRQAGYGLDEPGEPTRVGYGRDPLEYAEPGGAGYGREAFSAERPDYRADYAPEPARGARGRDDGPDTMASGYGEERFVPPYVQNPPGEYGNDIPARSADMPTRPRHGAYRDERRSGRSAAEEYQETQWAPADYSDGPRYR
jgi:hypothetical protein